MLSEQILTSINSEKQESAKAILNSESVSYSLIIRIFIGLGAFFSSAFFMGACILALAAADASEEAVLLLGLLSIFFAIVFGIFCKRIKSENLRFFVSIFLLSIMLLGKGLVILYTQAEYVRGHKIDPIFILIIFALALMSYLFYKFFDIAIDRFLSALAFFIVVYLKIHYSDFSYNIYADIHVMSGDITLIFMLLSFIVSVAIFSYRKKIFYPIAWALNISMILPILTFDIIFQFNIPVIAGIIYLVVGQYFRDLRIKILGYSVLTGGIIYLYYSLNTTLLYKSIALMISGLALFAIREIIKRVAAYER